MHIVSTLFDIPVPAVFSSAILKKKESRPCLSTIDELLGRFRQDSIHSVKTNPVGNRCARVLVVRLQPVPRLQYHGVQSIRPLVSWREAVNSNS